MSCLWYYLITVRETKSTEMKGENKMRVTKVMREYVEKQLDEKRYALGKQNRASYEARRKECIAAVENKVEECRAEIDEILRAYNMDIPQEEDNSRGWSNREVVTFYDNRIRNNSEAEAHDKYDRRLRERQKEMLDAFYLECDLGINKKEFLAAVAAMNFD